MAAKPRAHHQKSKPTSTGHRSVDGFFKPTSKLKKAVSHTAKHTAAQAVPTRSGTKHTLHHKQQRSKTLMRQAVAKPHTVAPAISAVAAPTLNEDPATPTANDHRLKRAKSIPKSSLITKFSHQQVSTVQKAVQPVPLRPAPFDGMEPRSSAFQPASQPPASAAETHFTQALSKADSHQRTAHKATKRRKTAKRLGISARALNTAAGVLAVIILAGFFAYQNIPNISMRIAASRAGFAARLPGYQPSGFAFSGPIEYGPGRIEFNFNSNSDQRHYSIAQQVSDWNSEALADNFLATQNKTYQTYQDKGRTIYLYDTSNATWVSGGVWYQIEGNDVLNNEQLIRIANSL